MFNETEYMKEYLNNMEEAYRRYNSGDKDYCYSHDIGDNITAGYGNLDWGGEFEFPLLVDQETFKIIGAEKNA